VASSADGAKLVAVAWLGHIYTSVDSGATWTQTGALQTLDDIGSRCHQMAPSSSP